VNQSRIQVSLDVGTSTVKVIIGEMLNDTLNIIGVANVPSEGLKKGSIIDIDQTVRSIRKAVDQAERMIGMEIRKVLVGIPAHQVQLIDCHGVVAVNSENREISNEDVQRVIDAAQVISLPPDREIINVIQKQFIVDSQDEIHDPRGMIGVRLEMEGLLATGSRTQLLNILRCVEKAGLHITDIVLQPLASGEIALSKDEKNLGAALIDIGGGTTTVTYFEDGFIQGTSVLPIGGHNVTRDISIVLRTTTDDAEIIKTRHGHAFYEMASADDYFEVPVIGSNDKQRFNQLQVAEIIEARMVEILELAQYELHKMGANDIPGGYVLTGGGSNLPGLLELAQTIFQNRVRVAIPDYIGAREPQFTTAVGIIKYYHYLSRFYGQENEPTVVPVESYYDKKPGLGAGKQRETTESRENGRLQRVKKFLGSFFE